MLRQVLPEPGKVLGKRRACVGEAPGVRNRARRKVNFRRHFKLIWGVQSCVQKFRLTCRANHWFNSARLTADEGRVAIVTNVAVRCGGRESYERRTWLTRTAKS